MTVPASIVPRVPLSCNGIVTDFPYPHAVYSLGDVQVVETITATGAETAKLLTTDWTVPETPDANGFYLNGITVKANVAPASGRTWTIIHDPVIQQSVNLVDNEALPVEARIETPLDRLTLMVSFIRSLVTRTLRQPNGDVATIDPLPSKVSRASKYLGFDVNGNPTPLSAPTGTSLTTAYSETLLAAGNAAAARGVLGLPDIAAKGDLIVGSADDTLVKVAVGAITGMVPVADSSAASGISWQMPQMPNPIINGNMEVWQRGTTFPVTTSVVAITADRKRVAFTHNTGALTVNRSTNVPSVAQAGVLFNYSLEVDVTAACASPTVSQHATIQHRIEGHNWRHFAQRDLTVSFWVRSTITGTYGLVLSNGVDRSYPATYTVNVSNTWEYKTVSIPASPTAGTWNYTNGLGAYLAFTLYAGSDHTGVANTWNSDAKLGVVGQVNALDNTANFYYLTGVKIELGSVATPIQFVPFEQELARCMRYYQKSFQYAVAPVQNSGAFIGALLWTSPYTGTNSSSVSAVLPVRMRATPTVTTYNPAASNNLMWNASDSASFASIGNSGALGEGTIALNITPNATNTIADTCYVHWTADAEL